VLAALFVFLNKFYLVTGGSTAKAMEGTGFGVYFAAWFVVRVERAFDVVVFVNFDVVMCQNPGYGQVFFDVGDLHGEKSLKIFKYTLSCAKKYNHIHLNNLLLFLFTL
jgi:hypothetical protein